MDTRLVFGGSAVDVPVLAVGISDVLDAPLTCLFLRMRKNRQAMSIIEIITPRPTPTPMPILAPRDRPPLLLVKGSVPFWSEMDKAKISSLRTETVGVEAVAEAAIMELREEICSEAAGGMERV